MNLIDTSKEAPYSPGVYMLTGINGIGKSTIVDQIASEHSEVVAVHASLELRNLFGNVTREELELLKPEDKLAKMVVHFTARFDEAIENQQAVILDTHLLVPIRKENSVVYEDIWSNAYTPYVNSMAMLSASASDIRAWRLRDEAATGRKRNTDIQDILLDQDQNIARFQSLLSMGSIPPHSKVIENSNGSIQATRAEVESIFNTQSK